MTSVVSTLIKYVNKVFVQLQSDNLLVSQQKLILKKLAADIFTHTHVEGSLSADAIVIAQSLNIIFERF